jgi:hypothetical protein
MRSTWFVSRDVGAWAAVFGCLTAVSCGNSAPIDAGGAPAGDGSADTAGDPSGGEDDDAPVSESLADGQPCAGGGACASGFCVDGVCCDSACTEVCRACAVAGNLGACIPASFGTDPHQDCPDDGISSCQRDGQCDGTGACRRYPIGAVCRAQSCAGSTRTNAARCAADGVCRASSGQPCDPYRCDPDGNDCLTTCRDTLDCTLGNVCAAGSCGQKPLGAPCAADGECNSLLCQQGACCSSACTGACRSCALPGSSGTCTEVPAGEDALDQCPDSGAAGCGGDGACDGQGRCRLYASGTVCKDPTCSGATGTAQGRCDGAGTCVVGTPVTCGTCEICTLSASAPNCAPVPAGVAPIVPSQCPDQGAPSCGPDGTCNGSGACRLYATDTVCLAASCPTGALRTPARLCDGAGTCAATTAVACPGGFLCDAANNLCKTSCTVATSAADCLAPNVCTGNICGTLELQYRAGGVTTATTVSPHPQFQIINLGSVAIPLSELVIRYWYTADGALTQAAVIDFAANSANVAIQAAVTSAFVPVTRTGADTYLQLGFTAAAGTLAPGGGTTVVDSRFNSTNPDFGVNYLQTGDYSFDATKTAFADWTQVTLYRLGTRVWGIEPPAP